MPNGNTHKIASAILAPITYIAIRNEFGRQENLVLGDLIFSVIVGVGTARIPDILEPPINPNHREFFHSISFAILIGIVGWHVWNELKSKREKRKLIGDTKSDLSEIVDIVLLIGVGSILLHLLMDGFTPKGLNIV